MNPTHITKRRHLSLIILRALAFILMLYGSINVLWGLGASFGMGGLSIGNMLPQAMTIFWNQNWNPFWFGMALLVPAVALALLDRRIVRWVIPLPRHECPQCGYALRELTTRRCPECGYVPLESPAPGGPSDPASQR